MKPRAGVALLLAIVVLLLIEGMAAGLLALSMQARLIAASDMRSTRARAAADLAVKSILRDWESGRFDTLTVGLVQTRIDRRRGDVSWLGSVERLAGNFVVRGSSLVGGSEAFSTGKALAVVRMLDRRAVFEDFNAALVSEDVTVVAGGATVSVRPDSCPVDSLPPPDALLTRVIPVIATGVSVAGTTTVDSTLATPDSIALGGIRWSELAGIADRIESGTVQPRPAYVQEVCDVSAAANWGDPDGTTPCAGYFPLIYAASDLTFSGGRGQGILAVAGTLTMTAGAVFSGIMVTRSGVVLESGSKVVGAVRSQGITLVDSATLDYSRCTLAKTLDASLAARRAVLQRRTFLPAF